VQTRINRCNGKSRDGSEQKTKIRASRLGNQPARLSFGGILFLSKSSILEDEKVDGSLRFHQQKNFPGRRNLMKICKQLWDNGGLWELFVQFT